MVSTTTRADMQRDKSRPKASLSELDLIIGIGDDAAMWKPKRGANVLATTDLLIQDVHFSLEYMDWYDVGWKAMAANVSDIAAMGGRPGAALVTLGLPPGTDQKDVRQLCEGLIGCGNQSGVQIVGGDTVKSPAALVVGVALYGETIGGKAGHRVLRRDAACPGDAIAVSGWLGSSAAGLRLLQRMGNNAPSFLREAHLRPQPRVGEGQLYVKTGIACAMDISDGLLGDLEKICAASHVGAVLQAEHIPVHPMTMEYFPQEYLSLALTGGEDYELVICGPEERMKGLDVEIVGHVVLGSGVTVLDANGVEIAFDHPGYDAFL